MVGFHHLCEICQIMRPNCHFLGITLILNTLGQKWAIDKISKPKIIYIYIHPKKTLEPILRILEAIVTEKLNCFKFVCYTVENSSIIKMITVTKPNHLQSPKRCQKIPQVGLSAGVGDLAPKNHSVKHSIKFHLGSQDEIPKKRGLWFFLNLNPKKYTSGRSFWCPDSGGIQLGSWLNL